MAGTVEISEEDFLRTNKLRETVQTILSNPKAKLLVQEATRMVYPNAVTPELDQQKTQSTVAQDFEAFKKEIAEKEAKRDAEAKLHAFNQQHEAGFDKLRRERGFTDAGVAEIRKIMEEKGILDHEIAADHWEKQHPPQDITRPGTGAWNFTQMAQGDEDADLKKLIESKGENGQLLDKMAHEALMDVRGQPRR